MVAPLGDVDARTVRLRRRFVAIGLVAATIAGVVGYLLGRRATRPLSRLRGDAGRIDDADPTSWTVDSTYGSPEVDDVAEALNSGLARLVDESARRAEALDAARAFASSATHELRTPLQSALTNVDIARSPLADVDDRRQALDLAHEQLRRMADGLSAVRALADAEFADLNWFAPSDLGEIVEAAVADEVRRVADDGSAVRVDAVPGPLVPVWRDGVRLAVANIVRNALVHARGNGAVDVRVSVAGSTVTVDDDGPGIAPTDRERLLQRFERGGPTAGSGLGLAIAAQIARAHGGHVAIEDSPSGGARVVLCLGADDRPIA